MSKSEKLRSPQIRESRCGQQADRLFEPNWVARIVAINFGGIFVVLVVFFGLGALTFIFLGSWKGRSTVELQRRINCAGNLKQIGLALIIYAGDDPDNGYFPIDDHFGVLHQENYLQEGKVYSCPSCKVPNTIATESDYVYLGVGLKDTNAQSTRVILAHDRIGNHDDWVNLLYLDGHVKGVRADCMEALYRVVEKNGDIMLGRDGFETLPTYQGVLEGEGR